MATRRKKRSRKNKQKRPYINKSENYLKKSINSEVDGKWPDILKLIGILASSAAIIALIFQLIGSRPILIIENIDQSDEDLLDLEITIKNSGGRNAYNVKTDFSSPYIISEEGITFKSAKGEDPKFIDLTKIVNVEIQPSQTFNFNYNEFADLAYKVDKAAIKLTFSYKDIFFIHYSSVYYLMTIKEKNVLKWKKVSESYFKDNVVEQW